MKTILLKSIPITKIYPQSANAVSILMNQKRGREWIYNCFIQITSYDNLFLDYYDFNYRTCPLIEYQRIKISLIFDIIDFVENSIENNFFVYLPVNEKYISSYGKSYDQIHDMLIYGYDSDSKIFYISDYFSNHYRDSVCTYKELLSAIEHNKEYWFQGFRDCIELLSYVDERRAVFERYRVKESLHDYLNSVPTKAWYPANAMWTQEETRKRCFGIKCYNSMFHHVDYANETGWFPECSTQAFYLMSEHKIIMSERLKYLKVPYDIIEEYMNKVVRPAKLCSLLKLKYDIKQQKLILNKISCLYEEIKEREIDLLEKICLLFDNGLI